MSSTHSVVIGVDLHWLIGWTQSRKFYVRLRRSKQAGEKLVCCSIRYDQLMRRVLVPYGEPLSDARTPLADVVRILLGRSLRLWPLADVTRHDGFL